MLVCSVIFSGKWRCFSRIMWPRPLVESLFDNLFHCQKETGKNRYSHLDSILESQKTDNFARATRPKGQDLYPLRCFTSQYGIVQGFDQNWAIRQNIHLSCSDDHIRYLQRLFWIENRNLIHQRLGLAIPIDLIQA